MVRPVRFCCGVVLPRDPAKLVGWGDDARVAIIVAKSRALNVREAGQRMPMLVLAALTRRRQPRRAMFLAKDPTGS
jgi:hypothetical protein